MADSQCAQGGGIYIGRRKKKKPQRLVSQSKCVLEEQNNGSRDWHGSTRMKWTQPVNSVDAKLRTTNI